MVAECWTVMEKRGGEKEKEKKRVDGDEQNVLVNLFQVLVTPEGVCDFSLSCRSGEWVVP